MSHDSNRTRIWFPMFSYFESSVDGIIPNEYDTIEEVVANVFGWIICVKDCSMLTARRFWVAHNQQFGPVLHPKARLNSLFGGKSLSEMVGNAVDNGKVIEDLEIDNADGVTKLPPINADTTMTTPLKVQKHD